MIEVLDGLECKHCPINPFRTQRGKGIKEHGNEKNEKKMVADDDLHNIPRMQSWFKKGKERYWVVDESGRPG